MKLFLHVFTNHNGRFQTAARQLFDQSEWTVSKGHGVSPYQK